MPSLWFKKNAEAPDLTRFGQPVVSISDARPHQLEKRPPCEAACPSGNDVRGWVGLIAQRDKLGISKEEAYERAWNLLVETNPFPATLGRVCPHPCEANCNREEKDGALKVNALERFIGDWAIKRNLGLSALTDKKQPESVGVIGAGPSGLSFAYQMARRGYRVTVYEKHEQAGGMLRQGIPSYRLPAKVLDAEISRLADLGIDLRLASGIGDQTTLEDLQKRHDLLYLGIGAQVGKKLGIDGEDFPGVWTGTEFLERVNQGHEVDLGSHVAVIGGGNTAIDAARMARRTGAEVTVIYRRTRQEMPAIESEIEDALKEGIEIEYLAAPLKIHRQNGSLNAVTVQNMILGEPDESGRRRPIPVAGATRTLEVSSIISAVSQQPDWNGLESLRPANGWADVQRDGSLGSATWAGGDVTGQGLVTIAIAQGRMAAEAAHAQLRGLSNPKRDQREPIRSSNLRLDFYPVTPPAQPRSRPEDEWLKHPREEIAQTISEEEFLRETSRCLSCGLCFGCDRCWMYCNPAGFELVETRVPGKYYTMNPELCEGCGKCAEVCPCGFLSRPSEDGSLESGC